MKQPPIEQIKEILDQVANSLVYEKGFIPEFPESSLVEIEKTHPKTPAIDLQNYFWISIDNLHSQDLDQITYIEKVEKNKYRLFVAISDVDEMIPFNSSIDVIARNNTTSIYTPFKIFPMLPPKYSYDLTSLLPNKERSAIVSEILIDEEGSFKLEKIVLAKVKNHAKLVYEQVSSWIDEKIEIPNFFGDRKKLLEQISWHHEVAKKIEAYRNKKGALNFLLAQGEPIIEEGIPLGIREKKQTTAHKIIENLMIASNVCTTKFFMNAKLPVIRRVVKTPKRWEKIVEIARLKGFKLPSKPDQKSLQKFLTHQQKIDPVHFHDLSLTIIKLIGRGEYILSKAGEKGIGHFDLALIDYAHTTAPNRRYPDLMMQRMLKQVLSDSSCEFENSFLIEVAQNCTNKEEAADKIERHLFKSFAAFVLSSQINRQFEAIVTGYSNTGTWVRLIELPVEGKLIKGFDNVDVGDHLSVKLCQVDIPKGFIDFCKVGEKK